jgi:hypothetical protein
MYKKKTGNHVHDCGLVVNPAYPCIGASPDGKICDHGQSGILEIKCPFIARNLTIREAIDKKSDIKNFHLVLENDQIAIKKNHPYWFQIQGQLLVTGATFCDLVTYTKKDCNILRVLPDEDTMEAILSKMCSMYYIIFIKRNLVNI